MQVFEDAKKEALAVNDKLDGVADSAIDRAKQSRWTWAYIVGGIAGILAVFVLAIVF